MNATSRQNPGPDIEERTSPRHRTLKGGKILTGIQRSIVDCIVRDLSDKGAKLRVGDSSTIPNDFLLYVPVDMVCYRVAVRHREGPDVGVEIMETVERPAWVHI